MDRTVKNRITLLLTVILISELHGLDAKGIGHYRCTWHHGHAPEDTKGSITTPSVKRDQSTCSKEDSSRLTTYINHCTKQNYVPLLACQDDGTWNCQSFIAMCKTLIHTDTAAMGRQPSLLSEESLKATQNEPSPSDDADILAKVFNPDENYFTMKEMAVAVLVSFITGATILAVVICVVWKCRHSHMSSEQMREVAHQSAKRFAAIHAITHIAQAISCGQDTMSTNTITNPQYGQLIASRDILEDTLSEHDRVYDEIFSRRKSSCTNADCIYANVNKIRKKSSVIRQNSLPSDLKRIEESAEESDVGYEADSNATPQIERRHQMVLGNNMEAFSNSPAPRRNWLHGDNSGPLLGEPLHFRNYLNSSSNPVGIGIDDGISKNEINKCDSGYHEELSESGLETVTLGTDKINYSGQQFSAGIGERKNSMRL